MEGKSSIIKKHFHKHSKFWKEGGEGDQKISVNDGYSYRELKVNGIR